MATILQTDNFIDITAIAADLSSEDIFRDNQEHKIRSIMFIAGANNDKCVIKNGGESSATITVLATPDVELPAIRYFDNSGQYMRPFVDFGDGVFSAGHKLIIEVE